MRNRFVVYGGWLLAILLCFVAAKLWSRCELVAERGDASLVVRAYVTAIKMEDYHQAAELCSQEWLDGLLLPSGDSGRKVRFIDLLPQENELFISANAKVAKVEYYGDTHARVEIRGDHGLLYMVGVVMDGSPDRWIISEFISPPANNCGSQKDNSQPANDRSSLFEG